MKYSIIIIILLNFTIYGQQSDQNTELITKYFQLENSFQEKLHPESVNINYSFVEISQSGINNYIQINEANRDTQKVNQQGNNNSYEHYSYFLNANSNIDVLQKGNQNSLLIFGENSISESLKIIQKSDFKSIVIQNFKK